MLSYIIIYLQVSEMLTINEVFAAVDGFNFDYPAITHSGERIS